MKRYKKTAMQLNVAVFIFAYKEHQTKTKTVLKNDMALYMAYLFM